MRGHVAPIVGRGVSRTYATWNPADKNCTLSNGNLTATGIATYTGARGTQSKTSGKPYFEVLVDAYVSEIGVGVANAISTLGSGASYPAADANAIVYYGSVGQAYQSNAPKAGTGSATTYGAGDRIGVGLDMGAGTIQFFKNSTLIWTMSHGVTGALFPLISLYQTGAATVNFGASSLVAVPSGYDPGWYQ